MTRVPRSDTARAAAYAALGFAGVLVLGSWAGRALADNDSFAGLGIASTTATVLAPLGGLGGALVAAHRHRRTQLAPMDRETLVWAMAAAWVLTMAAFTLTNPVAALTVLIFATTAVVVLRVALVDGAFRRRRRGRGPRRLHARLRR